MGRPANRTPFWDITGARWVDHPPNARFAIYHAAGSAAGTDEAVLDKETGLVWERKPDLQPKTWDAAIVYSYTRVVVGRKGWRLPTMEELLSLVDPSRTDPTLPAGHPFLNVQLNGYYWSSTLGLSDLPTYAWGYKFGNADTSNVLKTASCCAWLVRGGYGHDYPY